MLCRTRRVTAIGAKFNAQWQRRSRYLYFFSFINNLILAGNSIIKAPQAAHDGSDSCSDGLNESGYASQCNIAELLQSGTSDADLITAWLHELNCDALASLFIQAGYDLVRFL